MCTFDNTKIHSFFSTPISLHSLRFGVSYFSNKYGKLKRLSVKRNANLCINIFPFEYLPIESIHQNGTENKPNQTRKQSES